MTRTASEREASPAIESERVEEDLLCARCDHNLRTLAMNAACPECAFSIDESARAAGRWSVARARRLRVSAIAFVVATLAWAGFATALVGQATAPARTVAGSVTIIHLGAIVLSAFVGLASASALPPKRRRMLLIVGAVAVAVTSVVPVLLILGVGRGRVAGGLPFGIIVVANGLRFLFVIAAGWWIIRGLQALRPLWGIVGAMRAVLAAMLLAWIIFGTLFVLHMDLLAPVVNVQVAWMSQQRLEALGTMVLWCEVGGSVLLSIVCACLVVSLTRLPRRESYASDG